MTTPAIAAMIFIFALPMVFGIMISMKQVTQTTIIDWLYAPFVGLQYFIRILNPSDPIGMKFYDSIIVTFKFGVIAKFFHFALGLWAALLLMKEFKGRTFFRVLFIVPYAIPGFIAAITWRFLFLKDWGLINIILVDKLKLMSEKVFWLIGDNALYSIIITHVWRGWSFHFLMIYAALQTVQKDLYEAIEIDGGGKLSKFWHVTFPAIKPILTVLLVVNGFRVLNEFETVYVMMGANPPDSANLMSILVYNQAFTNWNFSTGSAMAFTWLVILAIVAFILARLTRLNRNQ